MGDRTGGHGAFGNCCGCRPQTGSEDLGAVKGKPAPCVKLADTEDDTRLRSISDDQARGLTLLSSNYGKRTYRRCHTQSQDLCLHRFTLLSIRQKVLYE